ncbi:MAG: ketoisovalerate oxidoreductase subunit VorA [Nitrospirae bacterium]|nr:ketoisovalerate oxidoreductase subunit VorA [Nitrospirota bacterium]
MKKVFSRPKSLRSTPFRYCPGCGHSLIHRLVSEAVDQLNIRTKVIGIAPVGCAVFAYDYFNFDILEAAHGRPPAVATALKRVMPDKIIFSYQGDGDLAAIGTSEIVHAANRGENLTVFFINNANYGMTGGQMAPTTVPGQRTTTTPFGRDTKTSGYPLRVSELLAAIEGVTFVQRVSVDSYKNLLSAKKAVERAFLNQIDGRGFSFVEILSPCPTDWGMTPKKSLEWIRGTLIPVFPLGIVKDNFSGDR